MTPAPIPLKLPSLFEVEKALCERSLYHFAKGAWDVLEPGREFKDNWHVKAVCEHLEAVSRGELRRLIINIPPRHMKSLLVSIIWPVWDWLKNPSRQFLTASYALDLAGEHTLKSRLLILSPWFQERWGSTFSLRKDQNRKSSYMNTHGGHRIAVSPGRGVGKGGDILLADDPQNTDKMGSEPYVEETTNWWNRTFMQRLNNPVTAAVVLTMQRLSEQDLCNVALEEGGWEHLMLPAEFEPARKCKTSIGFEDPRTKPGELLWENHIGRTAIDAMKRRLQAYGTAGQLQQRPAPLGGGTLKSEQFRRIKRANLPQFFHKFISWDTAATENENNDPTGATVWGLSNTPGRAGMFKLGQLEEWLETPDLEKRIPEFGKRWGHGVEHLIESAGPTGLAMCQLLKAKHPTMLITPLDPKALGGGKDDRATLAAMHIANGLVWVIDDDPDNATFLPGCDVFPKKKPRDVIDSAVQAIIHGCSTYTFEAGGWAYEGSSSDGAADEEDDEW